MRQWPFYYYKTLIFVWRSSAAAARSTACWLFCFLFLLLFGSILLATAAVCIATERASSFNQKMLKHFPLLDGRDTRRDSSTVFVHVQYQQSTVLRPSTICGTPTRLLYFLPAQILWTEPYIRCCFKRMPSEICVKHYFLYLNNFGCLSSLSFVVVSLWLYTHINDGWEFVYNNLKSNVELTRMSSFWRLEIQRAKRFGFCVCLIQVPRIVGTIELRRK